MKSHESEGPPVRFAQTVKVVLASVSVGTPLTRPLLASSTREAGRSGEIS